VLDYKGDSETFLKRGDIYFARDNYEMAVEDYTQAVGLDAVSIKAVITHGDAYVERKDYAKAIVLYTAALDYKGDSETLLKRGDIYMAQLNTERAKSDYLAALSIDPRIITKLIEFGDECLSEQQYDKALFFYDIALTADFDRVNTLRKNAISLLQKRADAYFYNKDYNLAVADYSTIIAADPELIDAVRNRAESYYHLEDYTSAVADYDIVIAKNPDDGVLYIHRGQSQLRLKQYTQAAADFTNYSRVSSAEALLENRGDGAE
jgi:tetratricopeptide (TPR) repeat protein